MKISKKWKHQRIPAMFLAFLLIFTLFPLPVRGDVTHGDFTITGDDSNVAWHGEDKILELTSAGIYTITMRPGASESTNHRILVTAPGGEVAITLQGVKIGVVGDAGLCALEISGNPPRPS